MDHKKETQKRLKFSISQEILVPMVERMQRREPGSMDEMRRYCKDYLARYFWRKMPSKDTQAQRDLIEETLVIAYANINKLKTPEAFVSWLQRIAHSGIYHYYKKREIEQRKLEKEMERQKRGESRSDKRSSGFDSLHPELYNKIDDLPEKQRQAVLLRLKGYKVREIAEIQGVSAGTVKSRLNYARIKIYKNGDDA